MRTFLPNVDVFSEFKFVVILFVLLDIVFIKIFFGSHLLKLPTWIVDDFIWWVKFSFELLIIFTEEFILLFLLLKQLFILEGGGLFLLGWIFTDCSKNGLDESFNILVSLKKLFLLRDLFVSNSLSVTKKVSSSLLMFIVSCGLFFFSLDSFLIIFRFFLFWIFLRFLNLIFFVEFILFSVSKESIFWKDSKESELLVILFIITFFLICLVFENFSFGECDLE